MNGSAATGNATWSRIALTGARLRLTDDFGETLGAANECWGLSLFSARASRVCMQRRIEANEGSPPFAHLEPRRGALSSPRASYALTFVWESRRVLTAVGVTMDFVYARCWQRRR